MRQVFLQIMRAVALVSFTSFSWAISDSEAKQVYESWKLPVESIETHCLNDLCAEGTPLSWDIKKWLAASLQQVPEFLRKTIPYLGGIRWTENATPHYLEGTAYWAEKAIAIESHQDQNLVDIMTHEIAHVYEDNSGSTVYEYLKIRFHDRKFEQKITEFVDLIASYRKPNGDFVPYDSRVTQKIKEIRLPHRHDLDVWAYKSNEYWAISVELYNRFKKTGKVDELKKHLSLKEIKFLENLFGY